MTVPLLGYLNMFVWKQNSRVCCCFFCVYLYMYTAFNQLHYRYLFASCPAYYCCLYCLCCIYITSRTGQAVVLSESMLNNEYVQMSRP